MRVAALLAAIAGAGFLAPPADAVELPTKKLTIAYRSHNGVPRKAVVLLPWWYDRSLNPPIPLVISPHGRGLTGRANAAIWGDLPTRGGFAVVNPDGHGRRLPTHSWGYRGQIADLARMPEVVERALPWLEIDRSRVYAFGGSMGGQEALLLLARHPRLLAGVAVFDAVTDFALQYRHFPRLRCTRACARAWRIPFGTGLQRLARLEIGGSPRRVGDEWAARSPLTYVRRVASSCVPLQMWWSVADRVVVDSQQQSGRFFWELRRLNPNAPAQAFVGFWIHTAVMHERSRLPLALAGFDLLSEDVDDRPAGLRIVPPPKAPCGR